MGRVDGPAKATAADIATVNAKILGGRRFGAVQMARASVVAARLAAAIRPERALPRNDEFADRYDEHVEYFERLKSASGLTDVEQREYQEASKYLRRCLYDAIQELGLPFDPASGDHGDAIIRAWEDTRSR